MLTGKWITDRTLPVEKGKSPLPLTFRKRFPLRELPKTAVVKATALGIYDLYLNGIRITERYFAPGFTSYRHVIQVQEYEVSRLLKPENELIAVVGPGWATGRFTYLSRAHITAKRPALLLEVQDENKAVLLHTDESWEVTQQGNYRFGDFYDGEVYDAAVDLNAAKWHKVSCTKPAGNPKLLPEYGAPVIAHEKMEPQRVFPAANGRETVYDFGQNFAGVICLKLCGKKGQKITVRHSEVLFQGNLSTNSLRTAKGEVTYLCRDGVQEYSPRLTYMGFRYAGISGVGPEDIEVSAFSLYSDISTVGSFVCSDPLLNRLQENIVWSGKSNFVDIPTDCPQRDERLGWTGDLCVFSSTACFNFDLGRFLKKWLTDVRLEQGFGGGIPFIVPKHGTNYPTVPTACWGDSCILVPWSLYLSTGDLSSLRENYPTMKRYLKAVKRWASLFSVRRDQRRIWKLLFQFGDWCAPGLTPRQCMSRGKWVATAYFSRSCDVMAQIAHLLNQPRDEARYRKLQKEINTAYLHVFTDGNGTLLDEFQTGYVLPLAFQMVEGKNRENMAKNLVKLVRENGYHLSTGFTGTPFLLFALADNGYPEDAYRLLFQDTCPSWLYGVKAGATTFWEEWDAVSPKNAVSGESDSGVSFNHYAYGAVGSFLYQRVAGLEPTSGGYKTFLVRPVPGGKLTWVRVTHVCTYGEIEVYWEKADGYFNLTVQVPAGTHCTVVLPSGKTHEVSSGEHSFQEEVVL